MGHDILVKGHSRSVTDILLLFWAAKFYIALFLLIGGILSFLWLASQPKYYQSQMTIGPVEPLFTASQEPVYSAQDVYSGTPLYTMQRKDTTFEFQHFMKAMRSEKISAQVLTVIPDSSKYFFAEKSRFLPWQKRYQFNEEKRLADQVSWILKDRLIVQPDGLTPFYEVKIKTSKPQLATELLASLYKYTDQSLRMQALQDTENRIAYLNGTLETEGRDTRRRLLTTLIMQEEATLTALNANKSFAAKVIETPTNTLHYVWPKPFIVYSAVLVFSLIAGSVLHGLIHRTKYENI